MIVNMPNKEGVTLATQGKYCAENIEVIPTFEMSNALAEYAQGTKNDITAEDLDGATCIRAACFSSTSITSIEMPNTIVSIGEYAFDGCRNLKSVTLSNSLTSVGYGIFRNSGVEHIVIPGSLKSLGYIMFQQSSLKTVIIEKGVENLNDGSFRSCPLVEVVCLAEVPPYIRTTTFDKVPETVVVKVPAASVEAYKSATNWSALADNIIALTPEEEALYGG